MKLDQTLPPYLKEAAPGQWRLNLLLDNGRSASISINRDQSIEDIASAFEGFAEILRKQIALKSLQVLDEHVSES